LTSSTSFSCGLLPRWGGWSGCPSSGAITPTRDGGAAGAAVRLVDLALVNGQSVAFATAWPTAMNVSRQKRSGNRRINVSLNKKLPGTRLEKYIVKGDEENVKCQQDEQNNSQQQVDGQPAAAAQASPVFLAPSPRAGSRTLCLSIL
jgi:hypothetical protein